MGALGANLNKFSTSTRFMESFYHLFNAYCSEINATHTREYMRSKALRNQHCGGTPPLGYDVDSETKEYILNSGEAQIVKTIFNLFENNLSYQAMADTLNNQGYTTKKGSSFKKNSFDSILRQQKYTGKYVWNRGYKKSVAGKRNNRRHNDKDEQVVMENAFLSIISEEQFNRVQEKLNNRKDFIVGNQTKAHYMLGGLGILKCKKCGSNMHAETTTSHGRRYQIYYCPNHKKKKCSLKPVHADSLNKFVANIIVNNLKSRRDFKSIIDKVNKNEEIDLLKNRLSGNKHAIENAIQLYSKTPSKELENKLNKLLADKEKLHNEIAKAQSNAKLLQINDINKICKSFKETLINSNYIDIRTYIRSVIDSIDVDDNDVTVNMK